MIDRIIGRAARRRARFGLGVALTAALVAGLPDPARGNDPPKAAVTNRARPRIEDFAPPEEFIDVEGIKTHFVARGAGAGRPVVFVHGFGSSTYSWRRNLDALAARGYRAYAIDVKGFGLSAKPKDGRYDLDAFTRHLLGFLGAMQLDRPVLVGNSMGGAIVARLALLHPERVGGIVLVDAAPTSVALRPREPAPDVAAPTAPALEIGARLAPALARSLAARRAVVAALRVAYHDPKFITEDEIEAHVRPMSIEGAAEALAALTAAPGLPIEPTPPLASLKVPALIVWGRHDRIIPVRMADYFARELPTARKVVFESSGHMPHVEEAPGFNALLAEFLEALAAQPEMK